METTLKNELNKNKLQEAKIIFEKIKVILSIFLNLSHSGIKLKTTGRNVFEKSQSYLELPFINRPCIKEKQTNKQT